MEPVQNIAASIHQNEQTKTLSTSRQTSTAMRKISRERHAAIFTVINLSRGTMGWQLKDAEELDEQIRIWALTIDDHNIPNECLMDLWKRARNLRIKRLQNGLECPDFTAELLAACWIGPNGLRAELEQQRVEEHRYLPTNAESVCRHCFGTGFRTEVEGAYKIARKCSHED